MAAAHAESVHPRAGVRESLCRRLPIGAPSTGPAWDLPAVFDIGGSWLLLTETRPAGDLLRFPAGSSNHAAGAYSFTPPLPGEGDGVGSVEARAVLPWTLPWRVIVVADRAGGLIESDLVHHLAEPSRISDPSWIRPGRVSWSWWSDNDSPGDLAKLRDFIDLAPSSAGSTRSSTPTGQCTPTPTCERLVRYARASGSCGCSSGTTPAARTTDVDRAAPRPDARARRPPGRTGEARASGASPASRSTSSTATSRTASRSTWTFSRTPPSHRIMVNFHGCTLPRGWTRTWPHLMTMEGVRGAETVQSPTPNSRRRATGTTRSCRSRATRSGPWTTRPSPSVTTSTRTSPPSAHELALAVMFESGLQHLADSAQSYRATVPTVGAGVVADTGGLGRDTLPRRRARQRMSSSPAATDRTGSWPASTVAQNRRPSSSSSPTLRATTRVVVAQRRHRT